MGKIVTRRNFLGIVGAGLTGLVCGQGCPGLESPIDADEYSHDVSLPPLGDSNRAQRVYDVLGNINSKVNMLYGKMPTIFQCTREDPMQFVVGFERTFSKVWVVARWNEDLEAQGWGGSPVIYNKPILNRRMILGFLADESKTEYGHADAPEEHWVQQTGQMQFDVGYTPGRIFIFEARSRTPYVAEVEVDEIRCG
jgi:hypothetical protein